MQDHLVYILSLLTIKLLRLVPRDAATRLLDFLADLAYHLDARHRQIALVNLKIAFPEMSEGERARIAQASFRNTARNLLEVSRMHLLSRENIAGLVGYDPDLGLNNFERARETHRGILYLTGHFGAWELLPTAHALYGYPLSFVTRPLDNPHLDRYLRRVREMAGNKVIPKHKSAREILGTLKAAGSVGILMDQNTTLQEGTFANFFGVPAATTTSMALFALRTDAVVLPGYLTPMNKERYAIKFLPPIEPVRTGDMTRDIQTNTERFNGVVERIIREQPESWLWGHKRWKNQPAGNPQDLYRLSTSELEDFLTRRSYPEGLRGSGGGSGVGAGPVSNSAKRF